MKPKIYLKCYPSRFSPGDVEVHAVTEDNESITAHVSSSEEWARKDIMRASHVVEMNAVYPDGYELVWEF